MKCDEKENDVDSGDDGDAVDHNDEESEDTHTHTPFWRAQRSMEAGGAFSTQKRNKLRQRLLSRNDFSFSNEKKNKKRRQQPSYDP